MFGGVCMYLRKLVNINKKGRFVTVSIPADLMGLFPGPYVEISALEHGNGIIVLPVETRLIFSDTEDRK